MMSTNAAMPPEANEQVLSTLNRDGSRRWLKPRLARGRFLTARRIVAYLLIAVFTLLPYIPINGKPAMLLDILRRQFTFFGMTFLPTDTLLLALFMIGLFIAVFAVTALFGRVWCGWACPQTVYMEFVYRPLERLLEGTRGKGGAPRGGLAPARTALKYAVYLLVSLFLAHTFLAYFVGVEALAQWVRRSPIEHPTSFLVMLATTGLMLFNFCYFREQTCIVACPYGRLQSVLLDRDSLIISYDEKRGEPRGRLRRGEKDELGSRAAAQEASPIHNESGTALKVLPRQGDCVDCEMCVTTCPTGIDIRKGLQMECVGCAQCIDACDAVMDKIGRPRGLIRYSSQAVLGGQRKRILRPRLFSYFGVLAVIGGLFGFKLSHQEPADVTILRGLGSPFTELPTGEIANPIRIKILNRGERPAAYTLEITGTTAVRLMADENPLAVSAGQARTEGALLIAPRGAFRDGKYDVMLRISDHAGFTRDIAYRMFGPAGAVGFPPPAASQNTKEKSGD